MIAASTILPDNASVAAPVAILIRPDCCAVFAVANDTAPVAVAETALFISISPLVA